MTHRMGPGPTRRGVLTGAGAMGLSATAARAGYLPAPERTEAFDVVVVGAGMAGCAAALQAAEDGARVCVLEKAREARMGGNSALAGGGFAMPPGPGEGARAAFLEDFEKKAQGRGNSDLYEVMAAHAREDVAWLAEHGIDFTDEMRVDPYHVVMAVVAPGFYMGMPRALRHLRSRIEERGGSFRFETKAQHLVMNDAGSVEGVRVVGPGGVADLTAPAVVLAAGGYPANTRLLESYSDPNAGALMVRGVPWATGDGLEMARGVGAGWKGMGGVMALHVAAVDPVETAAGNPFSLLPHAISVNREGQRFIDETRGYVAHGKAVLEQPGQRAALVFDEKIAELPAAESTLGTFRRLGIDVKSAGSLADLARAIEVPPEALEDTVTRYNAAAKEGRADGLEPPKSDYAHVVEGPTYHALYPLAPGVTLTFGGLMIDTSARVLEADERVIPGLFAAGEGAGHAFFNDYVGGGALTNCLVMGRIAGRRAAGG